MKNILIIFIATVILAGVFVGVLWWFNKPETKVFPKYSGPVEKIRIANLGEYSIFNIIARDQGYFSQNGLEAEITEYPSGAVILSNLLAGNADVAATGEFAVVANIFTNKDVRILAEASKQKVTQVIARKDKGISIPADLKGKKIGVTLKSNPDFFLGRFLTFNQLTRKDVQIIDLAPAEIIKKIEMGEIDAAVTFEPNIFNIQKKLGGNFLTWSAQGDQDAYALIISTGEFIKNHPQVIDRYMQSLKMAEQFFKDHNEAAKIIMAGVLKYSDSYINYIWPKISFSLELNQQLLLSLEDEARWTGEKVPNYLNFIYFDALAKVKPEAVTITH